MKQGIKKEILQGQQMEEKKSIYKTSAMLGFLVKAIQSKYPRKYICPTYVQRITYFLKQEKVKDFNEFKYNMDPYGPDFNAISIELSVAVDKGIISMKYSEENKGYFVEPGENLDENLLDDEENSAIKKVVEKYGELSLKELSEKTTDLFFLKQPTLNRMHNDQILRSNSPIILNREQKPILDIL
ncbi:MAG: hypothetical protein QMD06_03925 [Candidatus Altarchaeum sp.]|nr:hypothetical protein [Candidatus Altarchaeum sp.]